MSSLFSPLQLRSLTLRNRILVSPMCQYSADDGLPNDWHFVHLGSRAIGGAAVVFVEASAVKPEGRITPRDAGIWSDAHAEAWKPIADFIRANGSIPAIQIAHAGRKASCTKPWLGVKALAPDDGAWETLGPSAIPHGSYPPPRAMMVAEIEQTVDDFRLAAERSSVAGFDVVEVHGAHGYLIHSFLSPLSNQRTDAYGGTFENRMRFPLAAGEAVRRVWPANKPVFYRISATDWADGGWDLAQSIEFAKRLKAIGIDLVDCSSGGNVDYQKIALGPGYQVPFAEAIRKEAGIATIAVGLISEPAQAEGIVASGKADAVMLARAFLRDPYWPRNAAKALGLDPAWPDPYKRAEVPKA